MKSFIILNILVFVYVGGKEMFLAQPRLSYLYLSKGQSSPRPPNWGEAGECCRRKVVGGITYRLVERLPIAFTYPYYCSTDCVYMTEGSDVKYCFRPGGLESECFDEGGTSPPFNWTYPPFSGTYPPYNWTYPPFSGSYPPHNWTYPPFNGTYPPFSGTYPPHNWTYPPFNGTYPPFSGTYPPFSATHPPFNGTNPTGSNHNMTGGSTGSPTGSPGGKCRECLFVECEQYDHDYPIP